MDSQTLKFLDFQLGLVTDPDKLRSTSYTPVKEVERIYEALRIMAAICDKAGGAGISAVQIGIPWKLSLINLSPGVYRGFINCHYKPDKKKGKIRTVEACLSIPGQLYTVERWQKVRVEGKEFHLEDEANKPSIKNVSETITYNPDNVLSVAIQHELDHQEGILISDHGTIYTPKEKKSYSAKAMTKLLNLPR